MFPNAADDLTDAITKKLASGSGNSYDEDALVTWMKNDAAKLRRTAQAKPLAEASP